MAEPPVPLCSAVSRDLGEPMTATASSVRAWLLVEQPGPWGREAVTGSRLDREVALTLEDRAKRAGVRVLLIRRPGRPGLEEDGPRAVYLGHTGPRGYWLERRWVADPAELLHLDLPRLREPVRAQLGELVPGPLFLVCVNGKHDRCCATEGRPVAAALAAARGDEVWECSHLGGDRFAANVLCLPHGVYYGRVDPATAPALAGTYATGRLDLASYRGSSRYDVLVQAAEHALRERTGLLGLDDLRLRGRRVTEPGHGEVVFAGPEGTTWRVAVEAYPMEPPRGLTCSAPRPQRPPAFRISSLRSGAG
jgi:hypothetical protein